MKSKKKKEVKDWKEVLAESHSVWADKNFSQEPKKITLENGLELIAQDINGNKVLGVPAPAIFQMQMNMINNPPKRPHSLVVQVTQSSLTEQEIEDLQNFKKFVNPPENLFCSKKFTKKEDPTPKSPENM